MEKGKSGFTLLEVALVAAIATLLFMAITLGIGGRIAQGRYETASNEIADYMRDIYAETLNVENQRVDVEGAREYCTLYGSVNTTDLVRTVESSTGNKLVMDTSQQDKNLNSINKTDVYPGRTACAIYGKIVFFGTKDEKIHVFDIVGDAITAAKKLDPATGKYDGESDLEILQGTSVEEQLDYARIDFLANIPQNSSKDNLGTINLASCDLSPAAGHRTYTPNWGAFLRTANFDKSGSRNKKDDFVGFVMIVRAPVSGNVQTYFYERPKSTTKVEKWDIEDLLKKDCQNPASDTYASNAAGDYYAPLKLLKEYKDAQDDLPTDSEDRDKNTGFCIGSDDFYIANSNNFKYVEIVGNGQNASAIKLNEEGGNPCQQ